MAKPIADLKQVGGSWVNNTLYMLPEIKTSDAKGCIRVYRIFIQLKNKDGSFHTFNEYYYNNKEIPNVYTEIYTAHGVERTSKGKEGVIQTSTPTLIMDGLNIGKINATNVWTQALRDAIGMYNKHIKVKTGFISKTKEITEESTNKDGMYPPMLLSTHARVELKDDDIEWKVIDKEIDYTKDIYIQPKLDGERAVAFFNNNSISIYSRKLSIISGFIHLRNELMLMYKLNENIQLKLGKIISLNKVYFDGELYNHGMSLQKIGSIVRKRDNSTEVDDILQFHIFDCFIPGIDLQFSERTEIIDKLNIPSMKFINKVTTYHIDDVDDIAGYIRTFIDEEYEGAVIRLGNGLYTFGYNTKRSDSCFKVKQRFDTEFKVVGFTQGTKGKEVGAIIWVLANKDGKTFNVVPKSEKGSKNVIEQRKQLFKELTEDHNKFNNEYKDKLMTVEFEDYSEDGLPQRAKAIGIRHDI